MNNLIVHKVVKYVKNQRIAKLFFNFNDYRLLINTSNSHYDELYDIYGNRNWSKKTDNMRSRYAMIRLKINLKQAIDFSALHGHLEIIKKLYENYGKDEIIDTHWAIDWAATEGHLEVIKWLHQNRKGICITGYSKEHKKLGTFGKCTHIAMDMAALNGHLEVIKWLHENIIYRLNEDDDLVGYYPLEICTHWAMNYAAEKGHLEIVKWLHENRQEGCSAYAMDYAVANGHLEVVKWLKKSNNMYY